MLRTASSHLLMRDRFCSFEVGLGSKKSKRCHKSIGLYWGQFCYLVARCCKFVIKTCKAHGGTVYTAEKSLAGSIVVSETFEPVKARSTFPSSWQRNFEARERWCQMMSKSRFTCVYICLHLFTVLDTLHILHVLHMKQVLIKAPSKLDPARTYPTYKSEESLLRATFRRLDREAQNLLREFAKAVQRCSKHIVTFPYIPYVSH